jgi:hypothetical protein
MNFKNSPYYSKLRLPTTQKKQPVHVRVDLPPGSSRPWEEQRAEDPSERRRNDNAVMLVSVATGLGWNDLDVNSCGLCTRPTST